MKRISARIKRDRLFSNVYPEKQNTFRAFRLTPPSNIKVVIIGQDPYYKPNLANGLAFSVSESLENTPPSLNNIFAELEEDYQRFNIHHNPDLGRWAKQGVFLINRSLTVVENKPNSHSNIGWNIFTEEVIKKLVAGQPKIFVLWGANAQTLMPLIPDFPHHKIISSHPSPLSAYRGFFGSKPFSQINNWLAEHNYQQIDWFKNE